MAQPPRSAYDTTLGMVYFARLTDKIRRHVRGELRSDFHANLGKAFDARCADFLRVPYERIRELVLSGMDDEAILRSCQSEGRSLSESDIEIWNGFMTKRGWKDEASEVLAKRKGESGLERRDEIQTMFDYFEFDEGRRA